MISYKALEEATTGILTRNFPYINSNFQAAFRGATRPVHHTNYARGAPLPYLGRLLTAFLSRRVITKLARMSTARSFPLTDEKVRNVPLRAVAGYREERQTR